MWPARESSPATARSPNTRRASGTRSLVRCHEFKASTAIWSPQEGNMNLEQEFNHINPRFGEYLHLGKRWVWFVGLGIALMVVGSLAIAAAFIATLTSVVVFGIFLLCGGVVQIVNSILARTWKGFIL